MRRFTLVFISTIAPALAFGQEIRTLSRGRYEFHNSDCAATNTCSLLRVSFISEDYVVSSEGVPYYGKRLVAEYETTTTSSLTDYVFVQFLRGCVYTTRLEGGKVVPYYMHVRYGKGDVFRFNDWAVDAVDDNPVYSSWPGLGQFAGLKWNTVPGSYDSRTARYLRSQAPPTPVLYVTDHPSGGFFMKDAAQNSSLRLRMCLYRASDVPDSATVPSELTAEPITCYEWESWFVYDHLRSEFKWPREGELSCPTEPFQPE